jgi:hypothetical protein
MMSTNSGNEALVVLSEAAIAERQVRTHEKGSPSPGEQKRTGKGREPQPRRHTALLDAQCHSDITLTAKTWTLSRGDSPSAGPDGWQSHESTVRIVFHPDESHPSGRLRNLRRLRHSSRVSWGAGAEQLCSGRDSNPQGGRIRVAVGAEVVFSALPVVWKGRAVVSGGTAV